MLSFVSLNSFFPFPSLHSVHYNRFKEVQQRRLRHTANYVPCAGVSSHPVNERGRDHPRRRLAQLRHIVLLRQDKQPQRVDAVHVRLALPSKGRVQHHEVGHLHHHGHLFRAHLARDLQLPRTAGLKQRAAVERHDEALPRRERETKLRRLWERVAVRLAPAVAALLREELLEQNTAGRQNEAVDVDAAGGELDLEVRRGAGLDELAELLREREALLRERQRRQLLLRPHEHAEPAVETPGQGLEELVLDHRVVRIHQNSQEECLQDLVVVEVGAPRRETQHVVGCDERGQVLDAQLGKVVEVVRRGQVVELEQLLRAVVRALVRALGGVDIAQERCECVVRCQYLVRAVDGVRLEHLRAPCEQHALVDPDRAAVRNKRNVAQFVIVRVRKRTERVRGAGRDDDGGGAAGRLGERAQDVRAVHIGVNHFKQHLDRNARRAAGRGHATGGGGAGVRGQLNVPTVGGEEPVDKNEVVKAPRAAALFEVTVEILTFRLFRVAVEHADLKVPVRATGGLSEALQVNGEVHLRCLGLHTLLQMHAPQHPADGELGGVLGTGVLEVDDLADGAAITPKRALWLEVLNLDKGVHFLGGFFLCVKNNNKVQKL
eukprot:PhM_4_TR8781/c0_g1_i1/m.90458